MARKKDSSKVYSSTVFKLQSISNNIDKIEKEYPEILKILVICSYLNPSNIPLTIFEHGKLLEHKPTVSDACKILESYSLIKFTQDYIQVQPLIQKMVQQKYENRDREKRVKKSANKYCKRSD